MPIVRKASGMVFRLTRIDFTEGKEPETLMCLSEESAETEDTP